MKYEIVEVTMASGRNMYVVNLVYGESELSRRVIHGADGCITFASISLAKGAIQFHKDNYMVSSKTVYEEP